MSPLRTDARWVVALPKSPNRSRAHAQRRRGYHGTRGIDVGCVDRPSPTACVVWLESDRGLVASSGPGGTRSSRPPSLGNSPPNFKTRLQTWAQREDTPWIEFRKGERKDEFVQRCRARFAGRTGVECVGVAWGQALAWTGAGHPWPASPLHLSLEDRVREPLLPLRPRPEVGPRLPEGLQVCPVRLDAASQWPRVGDAAARAPVPRFHGPGQRLPRLCRSHRPSAGLQPPERGGRAGHLQPLGPPAPSPAYRRSILRKPAR